MVPAQAAIMGWRMSVTIYHNPACGTSRNTLAAIRTAGHEPVVVEYLKAGLDAAAITGLLAQLGVGPRDILRRMGTPYDDLRLDDPAWTDPQLVDFMVRHPVLIQRPIVVTTKGARLCRPVERVYDIL
jgi:arsenate reductase (glutaredoxin)